MTREDFIRAYAARSGLSAEWASLGFIQTGNHYRLAMPCGCDDPSCEGWSMIDPANIDAHLRLHAPGKLRIAYLQAISQTSSSADFSGTMYIEADGSHVFVRGEYPWRPTRP